MAKENKNKKKGKKDEMADYPKVIYVLVDMDDVSEPFLDVSANPSDLVEADESLKVGLYVFDKIVVLKQTTLVEDSQ